MGVISTNYGELSSFYNDESKIKIKENSTIQYN